MWRLRTLPVPETTPGDELLFNIHTLSSISCPSGSVHKQFLLRMDLFIPYMRHTKPTTWDHLAGVSRYRSAHLTTGTYYATHIPYLGINGEYWAEPDRLQALNAHLIHRSKWTLFQFTLTLYTVLAVLPRDWHLAYFSSSISLLYLCSDSKSHCLQEN